MNVRAGRPFRFGVLVDRRHDRESWLASVGDVDSLGYDVVLAGDHLGDGISTLPALVTAAQTHPRLRLSTYVIDNDYRHPAVLAMEAATVDQLTGGRLELGIGAGWKTSEYDAAGLTFDPPLVRTRRLCEAVLVIKALMGPGPVSFQGEFYRLEGLDGNPKPVQQPHMPILIAGGGKRLLEFAAREADIVAINTRHLRGAVGTGEELLASTLERRAVLVRAVAGERWEGLELHLLIKKVVATRDRAAAAKEVGPSLGLTPVQALESPYLLIGTADEMAEQLIATRDRLGFSYFGIFQRDMTTFAPVLERLRQGANKSQAGSTSA
jgi:probable F420-dependent oxidoreductase